MPVRATCWSLNAQHCERPPPFPLGSIHEASNHLWELYYGGWAALNIYYLGAAGVVSFDDLRIAGLSGICHTRGDRDNYYEVPLTRFRRRDK